MSAADAAINDGLYRQPEWQKRVIEEKQQLDERLTNLRAFFGTLEYSKLERQDQMLMIEQRTAMTDYSNILRDRIARFKREHASQK